MHSRLSIYCTRIIEAGWLIAVAVVPLHFNPTTSRIFEPDKIALLRSLALVMGAAWVVQVAERRFSIEKPTWTMPSALFRNGIVLSAFLLLVVTALATGFSVLPHISLWGYFGRMGGLYTTAVYVLFFFAIIAHLRTYAQLQRLVTTILLASLPVALYSVVQELGTDPILWTEAIEGRTRSTLGYPAALAATMALVVPLTLLRLMDARRRRHYLMLSAYLMLLGVQVAAILFARSRGPVLGLTAGLFLGGLIWTQFHHWRRASLAMIGSGVVLASFLVLINLPNSPLEFVQDLPYLDRLTQVSDPKGSTKGRALIWEGTTDLITEEPQRLLLGYGPDTIRFVLYPHYSADLGYLHGWRAFVDRAHNETFDVVVTTGLLGLLGYLLLITSLVYYSVRWLGLLATARQRSAFLSLWTTGGILAVLLAWGLGQTWAFSGIALCLGLLAGLFCYLAGYVFTAPKHIDGPVLAPRNVSLIIALLVGLLAHFVETNVGIAFSATNLLFWIYAALLIVFGILLPHSPDGTPEKEIAPPQRDKKNKQAPSAARQPSSFQHTSAISDLPALSLLTGVLMMTLGYSFASFLETTAVQGLLGGLWLLAGGALILCAGRGTDLMSRLRDVGVYAALTLLPLFLFAGINTTVLERASSQLQLFYVMLLGMMGCIAVALYRQTPQAERVATSWGLALATIALLGAGYGIYQTNVQPILASIYHQEARQAFQQRQYDLAATSYWHALDLDPDQDLYQLEYAQLLATKAHYRTPEPVVREQLFEEAERILQTATARNPYEQYHPAALGEVYRLWASTTPDATRREARYAQAVTAYEDALDINAENVLLWQQVAALFEEIGDSDRTRDAYEHILAWDSTNVGMYQRLAALHEASNKIPEAIAVYEKALRQSRQPLPAIHHTLATLYERINRLEEAVRASEQAVTLNPNVSGYQATLIGLYQRQGRCPEARARAEAALQKWPQDTTLLTRYQSIIQQCGNEAAPG